MTTRPPLPPFTGDTAIQKVRLAEDGWNSRDPEKVALAYSLDSRWRNRSEFVNARQDIIAFLARKWAKDRKYSWALGRRPDDHPGPWALARRSRHSPNPHLADDAQRRISNQKRDKDAGETCRKSCQIGQATNPNPKT
jgi:nuclear transport factor 2 (NTF2) superfamily protein